jgi:DNA-binding PadR family transcriptional regulator
VKNSELAILSLVAEQPRHGYEIEQIIEERGMRDWTEIGFSSIYYLLKKLEEQDWVEGRLANEPGRGPARKVFHITAAGSVVWREASLAALSKPRPSYLAIQLGLANLPGLPKEDAFAALQIYRQNMLERRSYVTSRSQRNGENPFHVQAMFDYSLALIEAEIGWVENLIQKLEQ